MPLVPHRPLLAGVVAGAALLAGCGVTPASGGDDVLRIFSARTYGAEAAYAQFTAETGIEVEFLNGSDAELRERLQAEGDDTGADVYLTVDAANLSLAAEQDLLQPVSSPVLEQAVPASLRDPQGRWFALSQRARVLLYNTDAVDPDDLSTYASLDDPRWKGRVCLRTSTSTYTQSLTSWLLARQGEERAKAVVEGWVRNDAQVLANDVEIIRTLAAGGCDVGITNHYYLARELAKDPSLPVGLKWPEQETTGVHVNISGAGVTRYADQPERARRFLEWFATTGQSVFVEGNFEYPVNPAAPLHPLLQEFGTFKRDDLNVGELGQYNAEAVRLLTEAGYA